MSWFKKDPPPKKALPAWVGLITPIVFAIIIGLLSIVYNGLAHDVEKIEQKMEQKVDNETLQMQIKYLKEKDDEVAEYRKKTDQRLEKLIIEMQQMKYQQSAVQSVPDAPITQPTPQTDNVITPEQYQFFMGLTPEQKEEYKKIHPAFQAIK
jgi:FtsZ-binding cell division protein ZapB